MTETSSGEVRPPFHFSDAALCGRVWRHARPGGSPFWLHALLLPDGLLGGVWDAEEVGWARTDGGLVLLDRSDLPVVTFDGMRVGPDGRWILTGRARDGEPRELTEVEPFARLSAPPSEFDVVTRPGARRRNLVVVRAGNDTLHPSWPRDIPDAQRNWDLCVSWFGDPARFGQDDVAEHQILQTRERKFEALYALFHEGGPFWRYDHIALVDDDMMLSWRDWNTLFATCRRFRLDLAQPSITGYANQPIVHPNPDYLLRYVSWVEIMTPIFSNRALRLCMPTFEGSTSGYGLDHVWSKLLGEPPNRVAIIDAVSAAHTRPGNAGTGGYDYEAAVREGSEVQGRYGAPWRTLEFGGIRREPRVRPPAGHPETS